MKGAILTVKSRSKTPWIILLIVSLTVLIVCAVLLVPLLTSGNTKPDATRQDPPAVTTTVTNAGDPLDSTTTTAPTQPLVDNPVDFATLQAQNSDIYAWLYVPGTDVDYPVLCSLDQPDDFYLSHNINKQYEFAGSIYSEKQNGTQMASRHTVIYGHNMLNGSMFATLHRFRDETFFNENDVFYIYTPDRILTYTISGAYIFDNRHLLNCFDLADDAVWEEYLQIVNDPSAYSGFHRDSITATTADQVVTLSTCVGSDSSVRYLVQGVLTDVQYTK